MDMYKLRAVSLTIQNAVDEDNVEVDGPEDVLFEQLQNDPTFSYTSANNLCADEGVIKHKNGKLKSMSYIAQMARKTREKKKDYIRELERSRAKLKTQKDGLRSHILKLKTVLSEQKKEVKSLQNQMKRVTDSESSLLPVCTKLMVEIMTDKKSDMSTSRLIPDCKEDADGIVKKRTFQNVLFD